MSSYITFVDLSLMTTFCIVTVKSKKVKKQQLVQGVHHAGGKVNLFLSLWGIKPTTLYSSLLTVVFMCFIWTTLAASSVRQCNL